jgi:hypothetical protein
MSDSDDAPVRRGRGRPRKAPPAKKPTKKAPVYEVKRAKGKPKPRIVESESEEESASEDSGSDLIQSSEEEEEEPVMDIPSDAEEGNRKKKKDKEEDETDIQEGGFDLPTKPSIMIFCGGCAAGKSYMLRYMMYHWARQRFFGFGLAFCPTAFNGDMGWLPEKAVKEEYSEEYLEAYITNLRQKTKEGKAKHGIEWELKPNFVIFDDCLSLLVGSKFFNNWVSTFRHTNTYPIILTQYMAASRSVSTLLRNCTNFAFLWPQSLENSLKAMHSAYGQMCESYDDFVQELNKCRERKYSCLVYKNNPDITTKRQAYCRIKASEFPQNFACKF